MSTMSETIVEIRLADLHDSPHQYRQTYSDATIDEIAASIKDTGRVLQPIVVRLRYPNPLFRDQYDAQDGYEIVFGHTRRRAAERAGLATVPCVVRSMSDAEVRRDQAAENIARADVHPIEEAQGLQAMVDADNVTADMLAEQLGKSRSYVYGRLKLLQLCPAVRKACLAGEIGTEVGLLIARVGGTAAQEKALQRIKSRNGDVTDGGRASFRQIKALLNEYFTLDLKTAIFDIEEEMLLPKAGNCIRCPKRSGNAPHFDDVTHGAKPHVYSAQNVGPDVCTDPDCFEAKKKAHLAREAARLTEAKKLPVIGGNRARALIGQDGKVKGGYIAMKDVPAEAKGILARQRGLQLLPVLIQDPRTGKTVEAVKRSEVALGAAKAGIKVKLGDEPAKGPARETPEERGAREADDQRRLDAENARRRQLLDDVRAAVRATPRSAFDLRLIAGELLDGVDWYDQHMLGELYGVDEDDDAEEVLAERLNDMSSDELAAFALDCLLVKGAKVRHVAWLGDAPELLETVAAHYGIASTPSTAARAQEEANDDDIDDDDHPHPTAARAQEEAQAGLPSDPGDEDTADASGADRIETDDAGCAGGTSAEAEPIEEAAR